MLYAVCHGCPLHTFTQPRRWIIRGKINTEPIEPGSCYACPPGECILMNVLDRICIVVASIRVHVHVYAPSTSYTSTPRRKARSCTSRGSAWAKRQSSATRYRISRTSWSCLVSSKRYRARMTLSDSIGKVRHLGLTVPILVFAV